jgi:DNA-binding SARP family transcriptional activator
MFYALVHCAFTAADLGLRDEVAASARRARELVEGSVHARFAYQADLMEAYAAMRDGDREIMRAKLASGLAGSRGDPAKFFLRVRAPLLSRLYAAALEERVEPALVREDIRFLRIPPPAAEVEGWPWPLRIRTLGRFEVLRDGMPLEFSRKAPRKTLQLLKAIIAAGGSSVPEQWLLESLWPDEEGDAASKSLGAAVLRLRSLLGDADAVAQQAGTLSLDRARCWVDVWAFESTGRLDLYQGTFLPEEEGLPWPVPMRERLRARFIQRLGEEGRRLEESGEYEQAIEGYLRGLDADSIIEPFYQGLMRCYARLDRRAEAAAAYRRLRQILSVTLGVPPSATTEKLFRALHLEPARQSVGDK